MVNSACRSLVTKVGNEWDEGEGRELSQRRGGKRYSMSSALYPNRGSDTASFRPHKQHGGLPFDNEFGVPNLP